MAVPSMSKTNIFIALGALILLGVGIAVSTQKNLFGSFVSQEIVLEDISFSLGGEQHLVAPKIIITGSRQSKETLEALFQEKDLQKLRQHITAYSADRVIIPELIAKGGIFENGTEQIAISLHDIVFSSIDKGKVKTIDAGEIKVEGFEKTQLVLTGNVKNSSIVDLDLLLGLDILTTKAETVDTPLKVLAKTISLNDFSFTFFDRDNTSETLDMKSKSFNVQDIKARPYAFWKSYAEDDGNESEDKDKESEILQNARDTLDIMTAFEWTLDIKESHITLKSITRSKPVTITIEQLITGKNLFEINDLTLDGDDPDRKQAIQSSLKKIQFSEFSYQPVIDGLKFAISQMEKGVALDSEDALELLKYMPKYGTFLIEDGNVRALKEGESEPDEFSFQNITVSVREQLNGFPISGSLGYNQLKIPLKTLQKNAIGASNNFLRLYSDYGVKDINVSNSLDYAWDEEKEELGIKLSYDIEHFFAIQFSTRFSSVSKNLFSLNRNSYFALLGIRWNEATFHYSEALIFKEKIKKTIEEEFSEKKKSTEEYIQMIEENIDKSLGEKMGDSLRSQIFHAIRLFMTESVEIEITAKAKVDRGLGIEFFGMINDVKDVLEIMDLHVTAIKKEE